MSAPQFLEGMASMLDNISNEGRFHVIYAVSEHGFITTTSIPPTAASGLLRMVFSPHPICLVSQQACTVPLVEYLDRSGWTYHLVVVDAISINASTGAVQCEAWLKHNFHDPLVAIGYAEATISYYSGLMLDSTKISNIWLDQSNQTTPNPSSQPPVKGSALRRWIHRIFKSST
jgi:hypothetical protein